MNEFRDIIRQAISASAHTKSACIFPTILARWPKKIAFRLPGQTTADIAIEYFGLHGFKADRTKMNLDGYPGLFRELSGLPPWIEVTMDDAEGPVSTERARELQPLIHYVCTTSIPDLLNRYADFLKAENAALKAIGVNVPSSVIDLRLEFFEETLQLARCIGAEQFKNIYEAVFDFDEFTPAMGTPDLFVWDPHENMWFFVEVKGPHDHMRRSQADWVRINWDKINGRFLLLVVAPDA